MITIDQFTLTAIPLELYFNEMPLGQATGFLWKNKEQHYLITNWHVVTARASLASTREGCRWITQPKRKSASYGTAVTLTRLSQAPSGTNELGYAVGLSIRSPVNSIICQFRVGR